MPNLTDLVARERAHLLTQLSELERNYIALCKDPMLENLGADVVSDVYGDQSLVTANIHSAMRPFFANNLMNGTDVEKRAALSYILTVAESSLDLLNETLVDFQNQIDSFENENDEHRIWSLAVM